jgi:nondiscriminating aspartyl-tRNA synthetase
MPFGGDRTVERVRSQDLRRHVGERVLIAGWLQHQRRLAHITFLLVRDREGISQVVMDDPAQIEEVSHLQPETVVEIEGMVVPTEKAPQGIEIHSPTVMVVSPSLEPPPIQLHRPELLEQLPTILDNAPVALRHPRRRAVFEIAASSMAGFRAALDRHGFTEIQTPKIVGTATESGATVFCLDYFGRPAYLAQSPQFYKQIMVGVFEKVYEVGPVFRAEPHDTVRHTSEYVSLDLEMGFIRDHRDIMAILREAVAGMVEAIAERSNSAVDQLGLELPTVPLQIPTLAFDEAQAMIERATGEQVVGEPDLAPGHERWLGEWAKREHRSDFVFVEGYPMAKRPFYTHPDPDRPDRSNSFDLLFRGLELTTGGQRLHRHQDYLAALEARGESVERYRALLQAYRHGMPPHGGFGMGLERWLTRLTGAANIRDVTLFPRDINRAWP